MENYILQAINLDHCGGKHMIEVEIDGNQAVIRFGASFTLRMNETQVDKLRNILYETSRELCIKRRDTSGVWTVSDREVNAESEMVQAGIDAREALKVQRSAERSDQQKVDVWDPQDPINW